MSLSPLNRKPSRQVSSSLYDQYCLRDGGTSSLLLGHPLTITLLSSVSFTSFAVSLWNCGYFPSEVGKYDSGLMATISASGTSCSLVFLRDDRLRVSATYKSFHGFYVTCRSYFSGCSKKRCSLVGACCSGLLMIDWRGCGLFSTSTTLPYTY